MKELENGGFVAQPPTASKTSYNFFFFKDRSDHNPLASCLIGTSHGLLGQHDLIGKGDAAGKTRTREMSCKSVIGTHTQQNIPEDSEDFSVLKTFTTKHSDLYPNSSRFTHESK